MSDEVCAQMHKLGHIERESLMATHEALMTRVAFMPCVVIGSDLAVRAHESGHVLDDSQHGHVHLVAETRYIRSIRGSKDDISAVSRSNEQ